MATIDKTNRALVHQEIETTLGRVPEWVKQIPDQALSGFWAMFRDFYLSETDIPAKYKELIGLAVSGATRCRYCALFHTEGARLHGATDREIAEASMMGGVTMMGSAFLNGQQIDYVHFRRETQEIVTWVSQHMSGAPKVAELHARA
jgi:AhpD family alkylhydroperoxidase